MADESGHNSGSRDATAVFRVHDELATLLKPSHRNGPIPYHFKDHPAVKDPIEALGIPHTEVDVILVNDASVDFHYPLSGGDHIDVYPLRGGPCGTHIKHLAPPPPDPCRFILDVHLGKLARRLRLLGFDALYRNDFADHEIIRRALSQNRIILTRDRGLLKHARVNLGCLIRTTQVEAQLHQVLSRYALYTRIRLWTRCTFCNGLLTPVDKALIADRLKPKTRRYYNRFKRCSDCDRLYWQGSHVRGIAQWLERFLRTAPTGEKDAKPPQS